MLVCFEPSSDIFSLLVTFIVVFSIPCSVCVNVFQSAEKAPISFSPRYNV